MAGFLSSKHALLPSHKTFLPGRSERRQPARYFSPLLWNIHGEQKPCLSTVTQNLPQVCKGLPLSSIFFTFWGPHLGFNKMSKNHHKANNVLRNQKSCFIQNYYGILLVRCVLGDFLVVWSCFYFSFFQNVNTLMTKISESLSRSS